MKIHFIFDPEEEKRAACGRYLFNSSVTTDWHKVTCKNCQRYAPRNMQRRWATQRGKSDIKIDFSDIKMK